MNAKQPLHSRCIALIPAFNPDERLMGVVDALAASDRFEQIVVVNDGSNPDRNRLFQRLRDTSDVTLLEHAVNLGKGAALKTGINHILRLYGNTPGIVTADADGQHSPSDIIKLGESVQCHPNRLVIGVRHFKGGIPLRSLFGNVLTKVVFHILVGSDLKDTQSGLRGIPLDLASKLLHLKTNGYDFEMEMLIEARRQGILLHQTKITTLYEPGNRSSHFNPLKDSLSIYLVFLRFLFASLVTSVVSLAAFHATYLLTYNILTSEIVLRIIGIGINFYLCREFVFRSRRRSLSTFTKFLGLVVIMGGVCYFLTLSLIEWLGVGVLFARIIVGIILYLANFSIQREFIFRVNGVAEISKAGSKSLSGDQIMDTNQ